VALHLEVVRLGTGMCGGPARRVGVGGAAATCWSPAVLCCSCCWSWSRKVEGVGVAAGGAGMGIAPSGRSNRGPSGAREYNTGVAHSVGLPSLRIARRASARAASSG
jgi:hypothetical protein